jgi:hypothetical protein
MLLGYVDFHAGNFVPPWLCCLGWAGYNYYIVNKCYLITDIMDFSPKESIKIGDVFFEVD